MAVAYNNLGVIHQEAGYIKPALWYYQKAIKVNPNLAIAYYNWGLAVSSFHNYPAAKKLYQQAAQIYQKEGDMEGYQKSIDKIR